MLAAAETEPAVTKVRLINLLSRGIYFVCNTLLAVWYRNTRTWQSLPHLRVPLQPRLLPAANACINTKYESGMYSIVNSTTLYLHLRVKAKNRLWTYVERNTCEAMP